MSPKVIYLEWDGPYTFFELEELDDVRCDYGVYQVYGHHPLYGDEALLFIGKAEDQTFGEKLAQEKVYWDAEGEMEPLSIYVGRLAGTETPSQEIWGVEMDAAARLLIYAHAPVFNGRDLGAAPDADLREIHLINWGNFMDLEAEISGARWLYKITDMPDYNTYGKHGEPD